MSIHALAQFIAPLARHIILKPSLVREGGPLAVDEQLALFTDRVLAIIRVNTSSTGAEHCPELSLPIGASEVYFVSEVHFVSEVSPRGEARASLTSLGRKTKLHCVATSLSLKRKLHFP